MKVRNRSSRCTPHEVNRASKSNERASSDSGTALGSLVSVDCTTYESAGTEELAWAKAWRNTLVKNDELRNAFSGKFNNDNENPGGRDAAASVVRL